MLKKNKIDEFKKYLDSKEKLKEHIKQLDEASLIEFLKSYNIDNDKIKFLIKKSSTFITHYICEFVR